MLPARPARAQASRERGARAHRSSRRAASEPAPAARRDGTYHCSSAVCPRSTSLAAHIGRAPGPPHPVQAGRAHTAAVPRVYPGSRMQHCASLAAPARRWRKRRHCASLTSSAGEKQKCALADWPKAPAAQPARPDTGAEAPVRLSHARKRAHSPRRQVTTRAKSVRYANRPKAYSIQMRCDSLAFSGAPTKSSTRSRAHIICSPELCSPSTPAAIPTAPGKASE